MEKLQLLLHQQEQSKIALERDLKSCMDDLATAILENEKLCSQHIIEEQEKQEQVEKNLELKKTLDELTQRFDLHIREASRTAERENELVQLVSKLEQEIIGNFLNGFMMRI